jgi:hypothetical protein
VGAKGVGNAWEYELARVNGLKGNSRHSKYVQVLDELNDHKKCLVIVLNSSSVMKFRKESKFQQRDEFKILVSI